MEGDLGSLKDSGLSCWHTGWQQAGWLEGCRVILEAWRSSGLSCWHTGWQKAGWLEGWLVAAGAF